MAGHSQFKNIMYRKGAQDAKRARAFAKIAREIMVAAKSGLPDPASNPRLRAALATARSANMPRDNIDRAMKKALGGDDGAAYEEVRYEGYGPGGTALIIETLTDNRNRTASEVRSLLSKFGGNLGESGSVGFLFHHIGYVVLPLENGLTQDKVFETCLDIPVEDVQEQDGACIVTCAYEHFAQVRDFLMQHFGDPAEAKIIWQPLNEVTPSGDHEVSLRKLTDALEDLDDVQHVFTNAHLADD